MATFLDLLTGRPGQLGGRAPLVEGGPGDRLPGMAPGQAYPNPAQPLPDVGFDLWRGPGGYYSTTRPAWSPRNYLPPAPYRAPAVPSAWEQTGSPLGLYSPLGDYAQMLPPPEATVWGVPVLPEAFRQRMLEEVRQYLEQDPWQAPPSRF